MATRLGVTVLLLALLTACATPRAIRFDTGQGSPLEFRPSSSDKSVKVDTEAFEEALVRLANPSESNVLLSNSAQSTRGVLCFIRSFLAATSSPALASSALA